MPKWCACSGVANELVVCVPFFTCGIGAWPLLVWVLVALDSCPMAWLFPMKFIECIVYVLSMN